jgi:hypothetical protein
VVVGCLAAWMACSIVWLTLLRSARACWALLFVLVGFTVATATLSSHRTISALDHELRKTEFEHQNRTKVLTNTLLMSSRIAMSNKLRRLRGKLASTHRSIIIPGVVTLLIVFLFVGLLATAESTQQLVYSVQAWYVVYLGTLYGHISHRRAPDLMTPESRLFTRSLLQVQVRCLNATGLSCHLACKTFRTFDVMMAAAI